MKIIQKKGDVTFLNNMYIGIFLEEMIDEHHEESARLGSLLA